MNESPPEENVVHPRPRQAPVPMQPPYSEPEFPQPPPPGVAQTPFESLESRPRVLQGGWWVSTDREHWWNGAGWVFGQPPASEPYGRSRQVAGEPSVVQLLIGLAGLILFGAIAFAMWQSMQSIQSAPTLGP